MSTLTTFLSTILGGVITGFIGLWLFWVQLHADIARRRRVWYNRTSQVARHLERAADREGEHPVSHLVDVAALTKETLNNHVASAEHPIDPDVMREIDELLICIMELERSYYGEGRMEQSVANLDAAAAELAAEAERARDEISLLW